MQKKDFLLRKRLSQNTQNTSKKRGIIRTLFVLFVLCVIGYTTYVAVTLPSIEKLGEQSMAESTKILSRNGFLLYEIHSGENRTLVNLDAMPDYVPRTFMAIEDDGFYDHFGFEPLSMIQGVLEGLLPDKRSRGGSTITQQLVKNSLLSPERTVYRKAQELILAIWTENRFSKDEIMEMYLNQISFGSNSYGIEAASQMFFGKSADKLELYEAAMLAALPRAPSLYSPYGSHPDRLLERRNYVLFRMNELGYIDDATYETAVDKKIDVLPYREQILAPHFVMYVIEQLEKEYGRQKLERGGFKIYTTLDLAAQKAAEDAVVWGAERGQKMYNARNAGLVAQDPETGDLLAMVGSKNYFDKENDGNVNVTTAMRQPGSSFKPFAYANAFLKGYSPATVVYDVETNFAAAGVQNEYVPQNYDEKFRGPVSLRSALAQSLNIPAVKTLFLAGIADTIDLAHAMGIADLQKDPDYYGLALVLGGGEVKLVDMVQAYSVFANMGEKIEQRSILKIVDKQNQVVFEADNPDSSQVLPSGIAYQITNVLKDNDARAPMFGWRNWMNLANRPSAGKSGTTNGYRDAWFIWYTPGLVAGAWAGNNDNTQMVNKGGGSLVAAPIWNRFMTNMLENEPKQNFQRPSTVKNLRVSKISGLMPSKQTPEDQIRYEIFAPQNVPTKKDNSFVSVDVDTVSGKLANEYTPKEARKTYVYMRHKAIKPMPNWQKGVDKWVSHNREFFAKRFGIESEKEDVVYVDSPSEIPSEYTDVFTSKTAEMKNYIQILSPRSNTVLNPGETLEVQTDVLWDYEVRKVEFFFNDTLVYETMQAPYDGTIQLPQSPSDTMSFTLRAKVTNKYYNTNTDTIKGTLSKTSAQETKTGSAVKEEDSVNMYLVSPSKGSELVKGEDIEVKVSLLGKTQNIQKKEIYLDENLIGTFNTGENSYTMRMPEYLSEWRYVLGVVAYDSSGKAIRRSRPVQIRNAQD